MIPAINDDMIASSEENSVLRTVDINDDFSDLSILHTGERNPRYAPPDRFNFAFIIMVFLGASTGFGWNFFITAGDYFKYALRNTTHPQEPTMYQDVFENAIALVATGCSLLGIAANTFLTRLISFKYRICSGFVVITIVFSITTSLALVSTDSWQSAFFAVTMMSVVFINLAGSVVTGGLFGIQGCLPSRFATAVMVGQAIAGLIAVFANIFSTLALSEVKNKNDSMKDQAAAYFGSAIGAIILCALAFWYFLRLPVVNYYLAVSESVQVVESEKREIPEDIADISREHFPTRMVLRRTWDHAAVLVLTFLTTLAVFPGLAGNVSSRQSNNGSMITNSLFLPISCFLVFNTGDLAGRLSHGFLQFPNSQQGRFTLALAILRTGLIPLFLFCNVQPRSHMPVIFGDAVFIFLTAFVAFTNGYLGNLGVMYGPKLVPSRYAETTGSLMGVCICVGLLIGALISFGLIYVI